MKSKGPRRWLMIALTREGAPVRAFGAWVNTLLGEEDEILRDARALMGNPPATNRIQDATYVLAVYGQAKMPDPRQMDGKDAAKFADANLPHFHVHRDGSIERP